MTDEPVTRSSTSYSVPLMADAKRTLGFVDIPGFPGYKASADGRIIGVRGRELRQMSDRYGHKRVPAKGTPVSVHRLMAFAFLGGCPAGMAVDHINGDRSDNRIENLRVVTYAENARNLRGVVGCTWHKRCGKWQAAIKYCNKSIYLGIFSSKADAIAARNKKAAELNTTYNLAMDTTV